MKKIGYAAIVLTAATVLFVFLKFLAPNAERDFGIQIESARIVALGRVVDVRVRVLDPQKAEAIFNKNNKPYLVIKETGRKLGIMSSPIVGPMRSTNNPKKGKVYPFEFSNQSLLLKAGDIVTFTIGEFEKNGIAVE